MPETFEYFRRRDQWEGDTPTPKACFCVGPQDGDPVCPCRMKTLTIQNGRYIQIIDHGPLKK